MHLVHLVSFISALSLSFVLTWWVRNTAISRGWMTTPSTEHHIHTVPIPRLGGVAIYVSFVAVVGLLLAVSAVFQIDLGLSLRTVLNILLPGTLIFLLGLYDDIYSVRPSVKFAVQAIAAVLLFLGGFRVLQVPLLFGDQNFGWLVALPLTILWVLWITNAFNLIDGLDGLAAGSALFSTMTVFAVSLIGGDRLLSVMTVGLAGAIVGFLRYNFNPATIFLGDGGSLFLGFMLSALALAGTQKTPTVVAVGIAVVSFGLPILDTVLSVVRRFLSGQPLFRADREHIHHKLLERGLSHRQVVVVLYGVSALLGLLSLFLLYPGGGPIGIVLFVLGVGIWLGVQHLGYHEFSELGRMAQRTMAQRQIIVNNLTVRRATTALAKVRTVEQLRHVLHDAFAANDFDGFCLSLNTRDNHQATEGQKRNMEIGHRVGDKCLLLTGEDDLLLGGEEGKWWYLWRKPALDDEPASASQPAWTLELEILSSAGKGLGCFILYRAHYERPLLLDVNLLISEFRVALSDAVERVLSQAEHQWGRVKEPADHKLASGA
jgi:UDP-GlcNAc:undecaprenyl-phosphate GlcNAc-1-phosphate transferase